MSMRVSIGVGVVLHRISLDFLKKDVIIIYWVLIFFYYTPMLITMLPFIGKRGFG